MQVIPSHFCCNLCKLPSFVHGTYIPKTNPGLGFYTHHFQFHANSFLLAFTTGSHTVRRPWKVCVQDIGCLRCCFCNKFFLQDKVVSLKPNPHARRAVSRDAQATQPRRGNSPREWFLYNTVVYMIKFIWLSLYDVTSFVYIYSVFI